MINPKQETMWEYRKRKARESKDSKIDDKSQIYI